MKSITLNSGEYLLVEVPEDSFNFSLSTGITKHPTVDFTNLTLYYTFAKDHQGFANIKGYNWQIVGKADSLSEDDWKGIVGVIQFVSTISMWDEYKDYLGKENWATATASGLSLLASHGMKPETTLILKQVK